MLIDFGRNLTSQLVDSLGEQIVGGEIQRDSVITAVGLQEQYGVSRTVVREALQILQSKGLVQSRTKIGTSILPKRAWNLLDPDVIAWHRNAGVGTDLVLDLEEVRENHEPWAARMAAKRRDESDLAAIRNAYEQMVDTSIRLGPDSRAAIEADLAFHQLVLEATHNTIMVSLGRLIQPVLQIRNEMALQHDTAIDFLEDHKRVLDAIESGDADAAEAAMKGLLRRSTQDIATFETRARHDKTSPSPVVGQAKVES